MNRSPSFNALTNMFYDDETAHTPANVARIYRQYGGGLEARAHPAANDVRQPVAGIRRALRSHAAQGEG